MLPRQYVTTLVSTDCRTWAGGHAGTSSHHELYGGFNQSYGQVSWNCGSVVSLSGVRIIGFYSALLCSRAVISGQVAM